MKPIAVIVVFLSAAIAPPTVLRAADVTPLHFTDAIPLPGVHGRE